MAEAVAGETRNPFVFVDPGAFINMFFGVGILKVKSLFRKLRKLAVRYGGVVVFFDEADSLGARGALAPPGGFGGQMTGAPFSSATCNGLSWVDPMTASLLLRTTMTDEGGQDAGAGRRQRFVAGAGMIPRAPQHPAGRCHSRSLLPQWTRRAQYPSLSS